MPSRQLPPLSNQGLEHTNSSNNNNDNTNFSYIARRSTQRQLVANNNNHQQPSNHRLLQHSATHHILQPHSSNQRIQPQKLQQPQQKQHYKEYEADDDDDNNNQEGNNDNDNSHNDNNQGDGQHSQNHNHSHTTENFHLPQLRATSSAASKGDFLSLSRNRDSSQPLSPQEAIKLFQDKLSSYELNEIHSYRNIFFVGHCAPKREGTAGASNNDGYDDDNGSYIHITHDHICYRYEV